MDLPEVERIARLARLKLAPDEAQAMARHMDNILAFVQQLAEPDLEGVEPCVFASGGRTPLRDDVVKDSLSNDQALAQAPERSDGFFQVPQVLAGDEESA